MAWLGTSGLEEQQCGAFSGFSSPVYPRLDSGEACNPEPPTSTDRKDKTKNKKKTERREEKKEKKERKSRLLCQGTGKEPSRDLVERLQLYFHTRAPAGGPLLSQQQQGSPVLSCPSHNSIRRPSPKVAQGHHAARRSTFQYDRRHQRIESEP